VKIFRTACHMIPLPSATSVILLLIIKNTHEDNSNYKWHSQSYTCSNFYEPQQWQKTETLLVTGTWKNCKTKHIQTNVCKLYSQDM